MSRVVVYQLTHTHTITGQKSWESENWEESVEPVMVKSLLFGNKSIKRDNINRNIKEQCVFLPACKW